MTTWRTHSPHGRSTERRCSASTCWSARRSTRCRRCTTSSGCRRRCRRIRTPAPLVAAGAVRCIRPRDAAGRARGRPDRIDPRHHPSADGRRLPRVLAAVPARLRPRARRPSRGRACPRRMSTSAPVLAWARTLLSEEPLALPALPRSAGRALPRARRGRSRVCLPQPPRARPGAAARAPRPLAPGHGDDGRGVARASARRRRRPSTTSSSATCARSARRPRPMSRRGPGSPGSPPSSTRLGGAAPAMAGRGRAHAVGCRGRRAGRPGDSRPGAAPARVRQRAPRARRPLALLRRRGPRRASIRPASSGAATCSSTATCGDRGGSPTAAWTCCTSRSPAAISTRSLAEATRLAAFLHPDDPPAVSATAV